MPKFHKKPVEIEAVRFTGSSTSEGAVRIWMAGGEWREPGIQTSDMNMLEISPGKRRAAPGDYIVKGLDGDFYIVKPDTFEALYEDV